MAKLSKVYLAVRGTKVGVSVLAAFSKEQDAVDYVTNHNQQIEEHYRAYPQSSRWWVRSSDAAREQDVARVEEVPLDLPRSQLSGAWEVEVSAAGSTVNSYYSLSATPATPPTHHVDATEAHSFFGYGTTLSAAEEAAHRLRTSTLQDGL